MDDEELFMRKLFADMEVIKERQTSANTRLGRIEKQIEERMVDKARVDEISAQLGARWKWTGEALRMAGQALILTTMYLIAQKIGVELKW
jgi:transposase-like protein